MAQLVTMEQTRATVIVPAHNEGARIAQTLHLLQNAIDCVNRAAGAPRTTLMVICNACSDDTFERARKASPGALVLETSTRGKASAINLALASADSGPVIVNDADVAQDANTLAALLSVLTQPGVLAASPLARFELTAASPLVRAYYRTFARHPYLSEGIGGAGVYGLSVEGRAVLGRLPPVAADDQYLRHFFPLAGQRRVWANLEGQPVSVVVHPPRTLAGLLAVEVRSRNGDLAVRNVLPAHAQPASVRWRWAAFRAAPLDFLLFAGIKLLGRMLMPFAREGRTEGWTPVRQ